MSDSQATEERRTLLLDAADDCLELANYLLNDAPNMGFRKEQRYRALAEESQVRAKSLRAWAEELPAGDVGCLKANEIENACTHEFRPIDSSGQKACLYCNERAQRCEGCDGTGGPNKSCAGCGGSGLTPVSGTRGCSE
jgi:hypothetical protein